MYASNPTDRTEPLTTNRESVPGGERLVCSLPFQARRFEFSLPSPGALDAGEENEVPVLERVIGHDGRSINVRRLPTNIVDHCIAQYGGVRGINRWYSADALISPASPAQGPTPEPDIWATANEVDRRIMTDGGQDVREFELAGREIRGARRVSLAAGGDAESGIIAANLVDLGAIEEVLDRRHLAGRILGSVSIDMGAEEVVSLDIDEFYVKESASLDDLPYPVNPSEPEVMTDGGQPEEPDFGEFLDDHRELLEPGREAVSEIYKWVAQRQQSTRREIPEEEIEELTHTVINSVKNANDRLAEYEMAREEAEVPPEEKWPAFYAFDGDEAVEVEYRSKYSGIVVSIKAEITNIDAPFEIRVKQTSGGESKAGRPLSLDPVEQSVTRLNAQRGGKEGINEHLGDLVRLSSEDEEFVYEEDEEPEVMTDGGRNVIRTCSQCGAPEFMPRRPPLREVDGEVKCTSCVPRRDDEPVIMTDGGVSLICSCGFDNEPGPEGEVPARCLGCGVPLRPNDEQTPPFPGHEVPYPNREGDMERYVLSDEERETFSGVIAILRLEYDWGRGIGAEPHGYHVRERIEVVDLSEWNHAGFDGEQCPECGVSVAKHRFSQDAAGVAYAETVECRGCEMTLFEEVGA